ncbi:hypothetical protein F5Y02DRAFT_423141 [Annulohypoxylon stygium]|nr:hypothetical protein F5Y02DRAFT_423141 [Annulohypoxylon stygium]
MSRGAATSNAPPMQSDFLASLERFKRTARLTPEDEAEFNMTSLGELRACIQAIQQEQEQKRRLLYMRRLDPFLQAMEQYGKVLDVFVNASEIVAYIWGPMKFILLTASKFSEAFNSILDAYQEIGEQIPLFTWQQVFQAAWRGFTGKIQHLTANLARHKRLIESHATIAEFEEIKKIGDEVRQKFEADQRNETDRRRLRVVQWLLPCNTENLQEQCTKTRSVCKDAGRWLINDTRFQNWFHAGQCLWPVLWINGIPGAGKTILSSVIVQEARNVPHTSTIFFYCKYGDPSRNTFISVARSLLRQLLVQNCHLLEALYETASLSGEHELTTNIVAKKLLKTALDTCGDTYIIIDGLDECDRANRKEIATWFQSVIEELSLNNPGIVRCLFVSQDDGIARKDLGTIPSIKITPSQTMNDLAVFADVWHKRIEEKFGSLQGDIHIANVITARAQGMFLFAKLLAEHLFSQPSRESLRRELDPAILPVKLDDAYSRILHRITEHKSEKRIQEIWQILGWIACAPRPLRWREIQAAASLDLDEQEVNHERRHLESPVEIFASLVEFQHNDVVGLIHGTAREYLARRRLVIPGTRLVIPGTIHFDVSLKSIGFLGFPEVDVRRTREEMEKDFLEGRLAFYDYASACWTFHMQQSLGCSSEPENIALLVETLDAFVSLHWSKTARPLTISKTLHENLKALSESESYDKISQAVGWSNKQLSNRGQGPLEDEALDLTDVTSRIRATLEKLECTLTPDDKARLAQYYGVKWFKCPRVNCFFYHEGFGTCAERDDHIARHERPFMCIVSGCPMSIFGCVTERALKQHLFDYHGIDLSNSEDFPELPKSTASPSKGSKKVYNCPQCQKKFTRRYNLKSHLRTHANEKPFLCSFCEEAFTRSSDCKRHESGHGEKRFRCSGQLEDGTSWGCKTSFGRADKLASHLRTKTGLQCIRPLIMQKLQHERRTADGNILLKDLDMDADALLSASEGLPTFNEFLKLCGLDKSFLEQEI